MQWTTYRPIEIQRQVSLSAEQRNTSCIITLLCWLYLCSWTAYDHLPLTTFTIHFQKNIQNQQYNDCCFVNIKLQLLLLLRPMYNSSDISHHAYCHCMQHTTPLNSFQIIMPKCLSEFAGFYFYYPFYYPCYILQSFFITSIIINYYISFSLKKIR